MQLRRFLPFIVLLLGLTGTRVAAQQPSERYFAETGQWVRGRFLAYWDQHGGLAQQGYPLTGEFSEISATDGKPYSVEYFERAVFEYHPEHAGTPYEILLSLVGVDAYRERYPQGAPHQHPHPAGRLVPETGKRLGGSFLTYWETHGGVPQQGYPISDEFTEVSALDGKPYTVQYFERAVFEYHPELTGTPYEVLLSQLGTYRHQARYPGSATPRPSPSSPLGSPSPGLPYPSPTLSPAPTATPATPRPHLVIPTPRPGYAQSGMRGSDRYLIWNERQMTVEGSGDIVGLDLASGQRIDIATAAGDQQALALDGNQVLWQQDYPQNPCQTMPFGGANLYRKSLPGGAPTLIARSDSYPTAAMRGDAVVWVTNGCDFDAHVRLWNGHTVQALRDSPGEGLYSAPALSDRDVAWSEVGSETNSYRLVIYNRATGHTQEVTGAGFLTTPALYGDTVFWADGKLRYLRLDTGTGGVIQDSAGFPAVYGNTLLWQDAHGIWGARLPDLTPTRLVLGERIGEMTVAGGWLVWQQNDAGQSARLDTLFAPPTPLSGVGFRENEGRRRKTDPPGVALR